MFFLICLTFLSVYIEVRNIRDVERFHVRLGQKDCVRERCEMDFSAGAAWMDGEVMPVSEAKISVLTGD